MTFKCQQSSRRDGESPSFLFRLEATTLTRDDSLAVIGTMRGSYVRHIDESTDLAKNDGLWAAVSGPIPVEARSSALVEYCAGRYEVMAPINRWLMEAVGSR